jgi:hypothetical protein
MGAMKGNRERSSFYPWLWWDSWLWWIGLAVLVGMVFLAGWLEDPRVREQRKTEQSKAEVSLSVEQQEQLRKQRAEQQDRVDREYQRKQQQLEQQDRLDREYAARVARTKSLCLLRSACERYPAARQECAVAAHFADCIEIKIGVRYPGCTDAGHLSTPPDDMPGWLDCFWEKIRRAQKKLSWSSEPEAEALLSAAVRRWPPRPRCV